jgi:SAM-dependent methyltransferase
MSKKNKKLKLPEFDKHTYYEKAVQNPQNELDFFNEKFAEIRGREPKTLREDFCGTAAISCAWTTQGEDYKSWGIDLDPDPISYGKEHHYGKLNDAQKSQMQYIEGNVLNSKTPKVDISFAFNFSYCIFKERQLLLKYFKEAYKSLNDDGVFFVDIFGGPDSQTVMTDVIDHESFEYFWECQKYNPLNSECRFAIHFKRKGEKKRENVFVYEWRLWTIMELKEIMEEAGFKQTVTYWEGEDEDGDGDGEFYESVEEENCDAWVTYIAAVK